MPKKGITKDYMRLREVTNDYLASQGVEITSSDNKSTIKDTYQRHDPKTDKKLSAITSWHCTVSDFHALRNKRTAITRVVRILGLDENKWKKSDAYNVHMSIGIGIKMASLPVYWTIKIHDSSMGHNKKIFLGAHKEMTLEAFQKKFIFENMIVNYNHEFGGDNISAKDINELAKACKMQMKYDKFFKCYEFHSRKFMLNDLWVGEYDMMKWFITFYQYAFESHKIRSHIWMSVDLKAYDNTVNRSKHKTILSSHGLSFGLQRFNDKESS